MLRASVPHVSSIFSDICCKCVYLDIAYISHICCKCFIWMLHMFCNGFSSVFANVLDICFKCFICLQTYVADVSSECFKGTSAVAHVAMAPVADRQRPAVGLPLLPHAVCLALSSPLLPLLSLPSVSPWQFELGEETLPNEQADARGGASPGWVDGSVMPSWWPQSMQRFAPSARYVRETRSR
jgi:hypothetical protein